MRRTATTVIAALSLATGSLVLAVGALPASAKPVTVTVKGSLGAEGAGYRVLLLSTKGAGLISTASGTGAFAFTKVKPSAVQSSTLQLISPSGAYVGPVVLKVDSVARGVFAAHEQLAGVSANLKVSLAHLDADAAKPVIGGVVTKLNGTAGAPGSATTWYLRAAVQANSMGVPLGASKAGLVAKPSAFSTKQKAKLTGAPAPLVARGAPTQVQGLDADSDGVPNVFDVDDNGNSSLDSVDPVSAKTTAAMNPWTDIRKDFANGGSTYNAELPGSTVTASDVADAIGGRGQFVTWMFLDEIGMRSVAGLPDSSLVDWARVDCGNLPYCGANQSHEAAYGVIGEAGSDSWWQTFSNNNPVLWHDYPGHAFNCPDGTTDAVIPEASLLGTPSATTPANGMSLFCRDGGRDKFGNVVTEHIWGGGFSPQTGADTLAQFKPGDVYTVQYQVHGEATPRSFTMVLAPYYATVPGLLAVNGAAPDPSGNFALDAQGKLTLTFLRPQRMTVAGETGTFMDQAGLHYGLIIGPQNGSSEFGCSWYSEANATPAKVNRYSNVTGLSVDPAPANPWQSTQWPLTDTGKVDEAPDANPSTQKTFSFTVDVRSCIADAIAAGGGKVSAGDISNAKPPYATLTAAGEQLTGGANRSTLLFHLTNVDAPSP